MTHTGPIPESAGVLSAPVTTKAPCPKCKQPSATVQIWESKDGAYTDWKYTCACGHVWWVDGADS